MVLKNDLDLLVLVNNPLDMPTKRLLIERLLSLEDLPGKGIEMSVVLGKYAQEFQYPTPFEVHFSELLKDRYINDRNFVCGNDVDPDLAAHMTMVYHRGVCLYGKEIKDAFVEIPKKYYVDSILYDLAEVRTDIIKDPVYYILNLCRVLYYLRENRIASKKEGGDWGLKNLPEKYKEIIKTAVGIYSGRYANAGWDPILLADFAEYMLQEIDYFIP